MNSFFILPILQIPNPTTMTPMQISSTREQATFQDLDSTVNLQCDDAHGGLWPFDTSDCNSNLELSPQRKSTDKVIDSDKEMDKLIYMFYTSTPSCTVKARLPTIPTGTELPPPIKFVRQGRKASPGRA